VEGGGGGEEWNGGETCRNIGRFADVAHHGSLPAVACIGHHFGAV